MPKIRKIFRGDSEKKMLIANGLTDSTEFIGPFPSNHFISYALLWSLTAIFNFIDESRIPVDGCSQRSCRISFTSYFLTVRSSRSKMFFSIGVLKNYTIFTGTHLFNKVPRLQACNFLKKRRQHRCFLVSIVKFLRAPFFTEQLWWLLLDCQR